MKMIDRLSTILALIDDQSVAIGQAFCLGDDASGVEKVEMVSGGWFFGHSRNLCSRHNQDVNGGLGINVAKGDHMVVLINDVGRNLATDNARKKCRHTGKFDTQSIEYGRVI